MPQPQSSSPDSKVPYFRMLGGLSLESSTKKNLKLGTGKSMFVLAYLVTQSRPVSRGVLATMFWGNRQEEQARGSLRKSLSDIRRVLGHDAIVSEGRLVRLKDGCVDTDLERLRNIVETGVQQDYGVLETYYAGEFLPGLEAPETIDWVESIRQEAQDLAVTLLNRSIDHLVSEKQFKPAIARARMLLSLDPFSESHHRQLMKLYAEANELSKVASQFQACRDLLYRELGVEPSAKTRDLAAQILRNPGKTEAVKTQAAPINGTHKNPVEEKHGIERDLTLPEKPSVAVLPFDNFGTLTEDDFFAAGLTEEIIANLSRFRELFVFSRSTTTALTREGFDIPAIHKRIGVDFVVEGSVRKTSDAVRTTFQLIDAATDGHLLVEQIERECTPHGVFEIQDKIARFIAGRIASRYGPIGSYPTFADRGGRSTRWETYNWITQFYQYLASRDALMHAAIRDGLYQALESDSESSDGFAALAIIVLDEYRMHLNERPLHKALDEAREYADRAVASDPQSAFAYQALAIVQFHRKEFEEFKGSVEKSLALNSGKADALTDFAQCYYLRGDLDRALELVAQSIEINPIQNGQARLIRAGCFFIQDRFDEALSELMKAPMPDWFWYHAYLVAIYESLGETKKAVSSAFRMLELYPGFGDSFALEIEIMAPIDEIADKFGTAWQSVLSEISEQKD